MSTDDESRDSLVKVTTVRYLRYLFLLYLTIDAITVLISALVISVLASYFSEIPTYITVPHTVL